MILWKEREAKRTHEIKRGDDRDDRAINAPT
jgi:hypothetical protein